MPASASTACTVRPATAPNVGIRGGLPGHFSRPRLAVRMNGSPPTLDATLGQITVAIVECPFCGCDELKVEDLDGAKRIMCCGCHSVGPIGRSAQDAVERSGWLDADRTRQRYPNAEHTHDE